MDIHRLTSLPPSARNADFSFEIDHILREPFDSLPLAVEAAPTATKDYGLEESLFVSASDNDRALFVAEEGGEIAGYVAASHGWNGCAMVDDLAVARPYRRRRIAARLMDHVADWAVQSGFRSILLETQSNNVGACLFYQRYGFTLGGFDRFLYRQLGPEKADEIALFWYLELDSRSGAAS